MRTNHPHRPEPINSTGSVLLGFNQLSLLHGLYDRPEGRAVSTADLARAAVPYVRVFRAPDLACLEKAALSLHSAWVERTRDGHRNTWTLTPRGRGIIERTVPAYLRGRGTYEGFAAFLEFTTEQRREECVDARIEALARNDAGRDLLARIECALFAWCHYFGPTSFASACVHDRNKLTVRRFLQRYVVRHGAMPVGIHDVGSISLHSSRVDFDLLIGVLPTRRTRATVENTGRHIILRAASNFEVKRLRELARDGAEWRDDALHCEPAVVRDVLRGLHAD